MLRRQLDVMDRVEEQAVPLSVELVADAIQSSNNEVHGEDTNETTHYVWLNSAAGPFLAHEGQPEDVTADRPQGFGGGTRPVLGTDMRAYGM